MLRCTGVYWEAGESNGVFGEATSGGNGYTNLHGVAQRVVERP